MTETVIRYPTDPTGNNTDNAVSGEAHTLSNKAIRVLAPKYGPFYTESFSISDDSTGQLLTLGTQYKFAEFLEEPTCKYNKDIAQIVIILDPSVSSNVRISYQVLGGLYQNDSSHLIAVYESILDDNQNVNWLDLINKVEEHPDNLHQYILQDSHGYEYVVEILERIRRAILLNDVSSLDDLETWVKNRIEELNTTISSLEIAKTGDLTLFNQSLANHIADKNNPHAVTKAQVSLDNVPNYPIATQAEAEAGIASDKLITPLRAKEAVVAQAVASITAHKNRNDNPHQVTKAQIGLGSVNDYPVATQAEAEAGTVANRYMTPLRVQEAINAQVNFGLLGHTNDTNNPHVVSKAQVGLSNVSNLSVASKEEAEAGVSLSHYMTPERTKQAILYQVNAILGDHTTRYDNPHSVTKNQVGLSNVANYPVATQAEAEAGTANDRYMTPLRVKQLFSYLDNFSVIWSAISNKPTEFNPITHSHLWAEITGKPSTFTPVTHNHVWSDLTGVPSVFTPIAHSHLWAEITGKPSTYTPSTHSHDWVEVTNKPATYPPSTHNHDWSEVLNKPFEYTPSTHTHTSDDIIGLEGIVGVSVNGPVSVNAESVNNYTITNYDDFETYTLSAISGSVVRSGSVITYTAPIANTAGGFIINGRQIDITVTPLTPNTPSVTSPTNGSTGLNADVNLTSSAYSIIAAPSVTHESSDWQLSTVSNFSSLVNSVVGSTVNKTTWSITGLTANTTYYVRVRHKGSNGIYSAWSNVVSFTTRTTYLPAIEQAILTPTDSRPYFKAGWTVALDETGTRAIVGDTFTNIAGVDHPAAYIFVRSGSTWTQEAKITASLPGSGDQLNHSVSIDKTGTRAVIGVPWINGLPAAGNRNAVYIFVRTGTTWTQEALVQGSLSVTASNFGYSVAISGNGDRLVVGAVSHDQNGRVYIYSRSGTTWTEEATFTASDVAYGDNFGFSVTIDNTGTRVAVGSYQNDAGGIADSGAVYVFTRSGTTWTQEAKLSASDKAISDRFGSSVNMNSDGSRLVVGAPDKTVSGLSSAGSIYIFVRTGTTWTQEALFTASTPETNNRFGFSVSIDGDGDLVFVGSPNFSGTNNNGKVFIFTRSGPTWIFSQTLLPLITTDRIYYGFSVDISEDGKYSAIGDYTNGVNGTVTICY